MNSQTTCFAALCQHRSAEGSSEIEAALGGLGTTCEAMPWSGVGSLEKQRAEELNWLVNSGNDSCAWGFFRGLLKAGKATPPVVCFSMARHASKSTSLSDYT